MRDSGEEDDTLVVAARGGDRQSFALLYHRYKLDVWNLAYLTLRNQHEAEDALQETFVKALRALSSTGRVELVRPWLLTICRNVCLDRIRSTRRRHVLSLADEETPEPAAAAIDHDGRIDFHRALATLPPEDREAFLLVDVLGCRSHEAAAIAGVRAASTLRSRLSRARAEIAAAVGQPADGSARPSAPEIWGVYHQPPDSAIVASFSSGGAGGRTARVADLVARLQQRLPEAAEPGRGGYALLDFLDRLDLAIPHEQPVIAVIDDRPALSTPATQHWFADHPRWQVRRPPCHASWLLEVRSLLHAAGGEDRAERLAALEAPTPFVWSPAQ